MAYNQEKIIPVYLFLGFLEAGKTKFIQESIDDPKFNAGERILLLVCEEGFEEYDLSDHPEITMQIISDPDEISKEKLEKLTAAVQPNRILIEYNGMWELEKLFTDTPEEWFLFQTVTIIDSATFLMYNTNMRSYIADKMSLSDLLYFNRFESKYDAEQFHRLVRALNRRTLIYFEYTDGSVAFDNLEDPLPYDIESEHFAVLDQDYAIWFRDVSDAPDRYDGKTVTLRALVVQDSRLPQNTVAVGRHVMTCCEADIQFCCMAAHTETVFREKEQWAVIVAKIKIKQHAFRQQKTPELEILAMTEAETPENPIAAFY